LPRRPAPCFPTQRVPAHKLPLCLSPHGARALRAHSLRPSRRSASEHCRAAARARTRGAPAAHTRRRLERAGAGARAHHALRPRGACASAGGPGAQAWSLRRRTACCPRTPRPTTRTCRSSGRSTAWASSPTRRCSAAATRARGTGARARRGGARGPGLAGLGGLAMGGCRRASAAPERARTCCRGERCTA